MEATHHDKPVYNHHAQALGEHAGLATGRDFTTPDGHLVPQALGEAGLRQRTALLIGGMLIGYWPENI